MSQKTMVILAAGLGIRMETCIPKVLLKIRGRTVLSRHRESLLDHGYERQIWVLGYMADQVEAALADTPGEYEVALNDVYDQSGSGYSLMLGLEQVSGGSAFMDGDLLYERGIFGDLPDTGSGFLYSAVHELDEEAVKIYGSPSRITGLRKPLLPGNPCLGESVGLGTLDAPATSVLLNIMEELSEVNDRVFEWEVAIEELARRKALAAVNSEWRWLEMDFPDDVRAAEKLAAELDL